MFKKSQASQAAEPFDMVQGILASVRTTVKAHESAVACLQIDAGCTKSPFMNGCRLFSRCTRPAHSLWLFYVAAIISFQREHFKFVMALIFFLT